MSNLITPFRQRYERSLTLAHQAQVEECADYLQHPEILISEFLEAYYAVERKLDPDQEDQKFKESLGELVLESFSASSELQIRGSRGRVEKLQCVGGAFDPLPGAAHPALERQGLDYVGVRPRSSRLVLGVAETPDDQTAYSLLLRALNCLAELAPPFQVARLRKHVVQEWDASDMTFDVQIGLTKRKRSDLEKSLLVLSRDLAEIFKARVGEHEQFDGTVGAIECLEFDRLNSAPTATARTRWRT
jgi:hypothetical protein